MKLCAQVTIDRYRLQHEDYVKDYVLAKLSSIITQEVIKNMTITSIANMHEDSVTYTGTLTASTVTAPYGISNSNTISAATMSSGYSQINMRVVEYTKGGKVTRVELQKYDDIDDTWHKIPRIQIEE